MLLREYRLQSTLKAAFSIAGMFHVFSKATGASKDTTATQNASRKSSGGQGTKIRKLGSNFWFMSKML